MKDSFCLFGFVIINLLLLGCAKDKNTDKKVICLFTVNTGEINRIEPVVSVQTDEITFASEDDLALYEIVGNKRIKTDIQFEVAGSKRYLYWIVSGYPMKHTERQYELVLEKREAAEVKPPVEVVFQDGGYDFIFKGKKVLKYNSETVIPPEGIESSYKRSGFITPLYAPNRFVLTRTPDPSSDHLHHYGLWNAWKKVLFRGDTIDFFAPQFGQGTVRHTGVVCKNEGPVFGSLQVLLEHITGQDTEKERVAMNDLTEIRVYDNGKGWFIIDLSFQYNPVDTFLIEAYRYAGFSFRATDFWTKENTSFFTSEGMDRDQADGERSRWCVVTGDTPEGKVSIEFMSHPGNYNHPEPMRIWPADSNNGKGNVYINYNPARNTDWPLLPGNSYLLRYRVIVSDGSLSAEEAWREFADPVKVRWEMR